MLLLRYTASPDAIAEHIPGHVDYLERHHGTGTFLASGQTVPAEDGGAIVARGVDRRRIAEIIAEDPFVRAGLAAYEIVTIDAARVHPDLAEPPAEGRTS
ncbi:YciI family protein [Actinoallomurus spadix]|uniref:YciI family protein n=1 Tax=Actinoallomurus spadix TaxID=79912 RepID=UPI0031D476AE